MPDREMKEYIVKMKYGMEIGYGQEIIRCKDCQHWYFADNRIPSEQENVCGLNGIVVTPDWFCADGIANDVMRKE